MPPLPDQPAPIRGPSHTPAARPAHPSPSRNGLRLEAISGRELGYWNQRFGIDRPYLMVPLGWGEWEPLISA